MRNINDIKNSRLSNELLFLLKYFSHKNTLKLRIETFTRT